MAANPQTKPTDLAYESAGRLLPTTSTVAIYYYCSARKLILIYRSAKGRRLSRPRHCSKGVQTVLKAEYRNVCHDKRNCLRYDSSLGHSRTTVTHVLTDKNQGLTGHDAVF